MTGTIDGSNLHGVASFLGQNLLDLADAGATFKFLSQALGACVLTVQQAAAVLSSVEQSRLQVALFERQAKDLVTDGDMFPRQAFATRHERVRTQRNLDDLRSLLVGSQSSRDTFLNTQSELAQIGELAQKFDLEASSEGLFVPRRSKIVVARTIREALELAQQDKSSLLRMSPREFEEFMAAVFTGLGYTVELTKATRDGGADLICLRSDHGLPFRMAVEVKRYNERKPIDISLIRAFVGANQTHRANKLVFVTTSYYTGPAKSFAYGDCPPHLLTLADYEQLKAWCQTAASVARLL